MIVQDVLELVKLKLGNVALSKNNKAIINLIYLGVSDLYNRFNLSIKSETVITNSNLSLYELRNEDVSLLLSVYNRNGRELKQTDITNSLEWEYKIINYRSFAVNKPKDGEELYVVYKASPNKLLNDTDTIDLPSIMVETLLLYVEYMAYSTVSSITSTQGRGGMSQADICYQKYIASCNQLEMQGYKIPLNSETLAIQVKGFV